MRRFLILVALFLLLSIAPYWGAIARADTEPSNAPPAILFLPPATSLQAAGTFTVAITSVPDSEAWNFLTLINNYRAQSGAGALQVSAALENSSTWMSNDLATHNSFSHTDSLGRDPGTRMAAFGYPYSPWGENIAAGYMSAQSVFTGWQNACDPDASGACTYAHRLNMLNASYKVIGIGRVYAAGSTYGWYWTTDFGGVVDQTIPPPGSPCDINQDGRTDILDVQIEVNMGLQLIPCTNPDNVCDVTRVQRVVNAVLTGQCIAP